jgi:hypothetical protein
MGPLAPAPLPRANLQGQLRKNLSSEQTRAIVSSLLWEFKDSTIERNFRRGVVSAVANAFHMHETAMSKICARALANLQDSNVRAFQALP